MRRMLGRTRAGFTLIELMIVVAIIGVLAVLAVFGVQRNIANAKAAEARNTVGRIAQSTLASYEFEWVLANGGTKKDLCESAIPVPASVPKAEKVPTSGLWRSANPTTGWPCLMFTMDSAVYYQYNYTKFGEGASASFRATAFGDLDGNGVQSTFFMNGVVTGGGITLDALVSETNPEE